MRHPGKVRWHYTVGHRWESIRRDGVITPATAYVPRGEKPAVWFSVNDHWEVTANKNAETPGGQIVMLDREGTMRFGGGLVRIGVDGTTAPYDWADHKAMSGVDKRVANSLYGVAVRMGSKPGEWFVTYAPVPRSLWVAVERWDDIAGRWEPVARSEWEVETGDTAAGTIAESPQQ